MARKNFVTIWHEVLELYCKKIYDELFEPDHKYECETMLFFVVAEIFFLRACMERRQWRGSRPRWWLSTKALLRAWQAAEAQAPHTDLVFIEKCDAYYVANNAQASTLHPGLGCV